MCLLSVPIHPTHNPFPHRPLDKARLGLVPAIGGKGHVPATPSITSLTDVPIPSPAVPIPPPPLFSPHIKTYEVDSESLLPGVIDDLILVAQLWNLERTKRDESSPDFSIPFDVLDVLKSTTRAIRSTRNYLLSLPDESTDSLRSKVQFQPKNLGPRSRESSSTSTTATASSHGQTAASDPIARIRRSSLEVLTVLRQVEENYRLPLDDEAYDAQSDVAQSRAFNGSIDLPQDDETATSRSDFDPDISVSFSLVQVQGQYKSVPVWEDDDDDTSLERDEAKEKKDGWEERLVLGTGWLYRSDVKLADLQHERSVVASYLDIVDEVLFNGKPASTVSATDERGWERVRKSREGKASYRLAKNRRVSAGDGEARGIGLGLAVHAGDFGKRRISTGMVDLVERMHLTEEPEDFEDTREDEGVDEASSDDNLPEWAKRSTFPGDNIGASCIFRTSLQQTFILAIGRSHTLLANFLPSSLLPALGPPNSRTEFLLSLSSGQLLCVAYNACVRKSKKPWGFISKDSIHNIISLEKAALINGDEDGSKKVWTFRRTDNLRLWIG